MEFPDLSKLPNEVSSNDSLPSNDLSSEHESPPTSMSGPSSKRQKRTSSDFEDSDFFSDIGCNASVARPEYSLLGIPAEVRIRIIRWYVMMNTPSLHGDWSSHTENLPQMAPLWLLSVNKLIRGEALPLACQILSVLPRYCYINWKIHRLNNGFSGMLPWWTTLETFCVTRWNHLNDAICHMHNLRKIVLNWHYLSTDNLDYGIGTWCLSQERHLNIISECVTDCEIRALVLSPDVGIGLQQESRRFWVELVKNLPSACVGKIEIQVAATILVRCGILVSPSYTSCLHFKLTIVCRMSGSISPTL